MLDRKLRRKSNEPKGKIKEKTERKIGEDRVWSIISRALIVLFTIIFIVVAGIIISLKILPGKYLIPLCVLALIITAAGIYLVFRKKTRNGLKTIISILSAIFIVILSFVGLKLVKTLDFLGDMTTETVNAKTYSVVVLKDSEYTKIDDLQYRLLLYYDNALNQNQPAITKLTDVMTLVTEKTDNINELADKLLHDKVDAILIEDSYYAIIEEEQEDFKNKTKVIYTFALEDVITTIAKEVSVTDEPFVVFVSGIDSYGKISSVARSDVNMIAVINPKTKQVLLVNTPRDYYVKLHGTSGYRDKLTHAGIYGIDMSVKTMEDLYDIDVNYYVRVNFTSLIDIIDAIGGVNVYSEYDFTSRIGKYHFVKGYNQMNGKQALGFARERYSFAEGDRMRGQNQQAVISAMINKVCSSTTILTRFDALLDSLKGSFQTNMEYTKMIDLVRMQISEGGEWNISSISVDGSGSMERTYSMGKRLLSVLIPYAGSVNKAESMIKAVLNGEMLEAGSLDISNYNDYLVVSRGEYKDEEDKDPEENPEVEDNNAGDNTENSGNTGDAGNTEDNTGNSDNTGDTGNTGDNTGDGGNTGDTGNAGDNTGNSGNTGDAGDTEDNTGNSGDTGDAGNVGDNTGDGGNTGDAGNVGDNTGDSGNTGDAGNAGDSAGNSSNSGDAGNDENTADTNAEQ